MDPALDPGTLAWIAEAMGPSARIVSTEPMPEAQMHMTAIEVQGAAGAMYSLALRRYHDAARLGSDPWYAPGNEAAALRLLVLSPVPAPVLIAADIDGVVCGMPALLTTRLAGQVVWAPDDMDDYLRQMATSLAAIHACPGAKNDLLPYEPYYSRDEISVPSWSSRRHMWKKAIGVAFAERPASRSCFIHRDYHPFNILWSGARLTGVVDWLTAAWGPPGIDLARMRINLASELGLEVADRFLDIYEEVTGAREDRHPYWDLQDAVDSLPEAEEKTPADAAEALKWDRFELWVESVLSEI
jgi:aminoglycoside phosphotransferase (APT) family kinase protein